MNGSAAHGYAIVWSPLKPGEEPGRMFALEDEVVLPFFLQGDHLEYFQETGKLTVDLRDLLFGLAYSFFDAPSDQDMNPCRTIYRSILENLCEKFDNVRNLEDLFVRVREQVHGFGPGVGLKVLRNGLKVLGTSPRLASLLILDLWRSIERGPPEGAGKWLEEMDRLYEDLDMYAVADPPIMQLLVVIRYLIFKVQGRAEESIHWYDSFVESLVTEKRLVQTVHAVKELPVLNLETLQAILRVSDT